jgi:hypothetical protein
MIHNNLAVYNQLPMRTCVTKLLLLGLLAGVPGCGRHDDINKTYVFEDFTKAYQIRHVPMVGNKYTVKVEGAFDGKLNIRVECLSSPDFPFDAKYKQSSCFKESKVYTDSVRIDINNMEIYQADLAHNTYIYPNTARRGKVTVTIKEWTPQD